MLEASQKQDYEKAAQIRDKKMAIERISEKQKVSNISENNIDVIGVAKNELCVCIEIFFVRGSKMIGREHYFFDDLVHMQDDEIIAGFIKQYYMDNLNIPSKIMIKEQLEERAIIEEWLGNIAGRKIELKAPQKGEKLRFVEMAEKNAMVTLNNKSEEKQSVLQELQEVLGMETLPRKIETFDISNISGNFMVAGMCVLQDGVVNKKLSRRFKIKTVLDQDDPRCMKEVVSRRIKHSIGTDNSGFGKLPDAIFVDGGITQIHAVQDAIRENGVTIPVYGMVKDSTHTTRALIDDQRREIRISEQLMHLITHFQDTVHETAIEYHRKLRDKEITKSRLDNITGIGKVKKQELLKRFGSVDKIKQAKIEELVGIKGITENLANKIKQELE